jgi:hypothetical protein
LLADTERAVRNWQELNAKIALLDSKDPDNIAFAKQSLKSTGKEKNPAAAALLTLLSNNPDRESVQIGFKFLFNRDNLSEKQSAGSILRKAIAIKTEQSKQAEWGRFNH